MKRKSKNFNVCMKQYAYTFGLSKRVIQTLLLMTLFVPSLLAVDIPSPQSTEIKGVVTDKKTGETIVGATILVKGTTIGVSTDFDGAFSIKADVSNVLVISYIGYSTKEITIESNEILSIQLEEDAKALEEVVVVGYGTQKKVNLSGSVSSVNMDDLVESRPITNISTALAGMAAGVQVSSSSNQPGNDNASIKIRGQGTLNSSSPLVIVDGVESNISFVSPQDIESMSILKDAASAAIYGSRAANGVILITTKKGKRGEMKVDYNGYVSFESIRETLTPVSNYADYMEYVNEGLTNSNPDGARFSQEIIDEWRNDAGQNPLKYPNTNWIEETFKPAVSTNHTVSISGGSEKIRFYTSFGYQDNPGVMENAGFEKYSARINLNADVKKWLKVGLQASGFKSNMEPAGKYKSSGTHVDQVFTYASATTPGMVFRADDGRYGAMNNLEDDAQSATNNPLRRLNSIDGNHQRNNTRARFFATLTPLKGLDITASYSYEADNQLRETKPVFNDGWNFKENIVTSVGSGKTSISNQSWYSERNFNDVVATYSHDFFEDRLGFKVLAGASQEQYLTKNFGATKFDMVDLNLGVINGAIGDATASGSSSEWAMQSFFGRLNLGWEDKYLFEFNLRSDASSRFLSDNRVGYFPSASGAWRIDQEPFMKDLVSKGLSNLKVRVSYGALGNNSVGNYDAIAVYSNSNYVLNNGLMLGLAQTSIANANLTWESTYITDIGLDFGFYNNRLSGTIDYFNKKTEDILINLPAPDVHGNASIPKQNSATVINEGLEVTLGWQDQVGDFTYGINGNFSFVKNVVDKFKGEEYSLSGANMIKEGLSINSQYLLSVDRIIQTDEDLQLVQDIVDNAPMDDNGKKRNPFASYKRPEKGDLLYKDTNGDGIINDDDRSVLSDGANPKFTYGITANIAWKGIDFSMLIQGVEGVKVFWKHDSYNTPTVRYGYQLNKEVVEGRWYEGRTDAIYPRLLQNDDTRNTKNSDFYLQDKSFVKIKNIQLGYTLPKSWVNSIQIERVRFYGSLENFFTFTDYKGFDPEVSGIAYPTMKQAVFGLNITF